MLRSVAGHGLRRLLVVLAGGIAFGAAMSALKGNGDGVREAIGNTSAPWLLLPFIAGAWVGGRRVLRAGLVGLAVSIAALGAFYFANSFVLDLGPHPWPQDLVLTVEAGKRYFLLGLVSGPIFGALGGWWQRRQSALVGVLIAGLLVAEPFAWLLYEATSRGHFIDHPKVWVVEGFVGLVACILAGTVARPTRLIPVRADVDP